MLLPPILFGIPGPPLGWHPDKDEPDEFAVRPAQMLQTEDRLRQPGTTHPGIGQPPQSWDQSDGGVRNPTAGLFQ